MDIRSLKNGDVPLSLREIDIPSDLKILVLGPHPDDFDAIGVTMRYFHNKGNSIMVAAVPTGSGVEDDYASESSLSDFTRIRMAEQEASLRYFGLHETALTWLDLARDENDQVLDSEGNRRKIEKYFLRVRPNLVFLPHGNDSNSAHRSVYTMIRAVIIKNKLNLTLFLIRDPKTIDMRIDCYMAFGQREAEWKAELLRFHDTQQQRNLNTRGHGFDQRLLNVNRAIAEELNSPAEFAEAFEVESWI